MAKVTKPIRRIAGIPLNISLKPRPNDGKDLASDIFRAVKDLENAESLATKTSEKENQIQVKAEVEAVGKTDITLVTVEKVEIRETTSNLHTEILDTKLQNYQNRENIKVVGAVDSKNPIERLFEKSKARELYEILLNLTHKSEESPTDKVRVPRSFLMKNTGIKTRITLDQNLKRLEKLGLIEITSIIGEQEGNIYQVNLPENLNL